VHFKYPWVVIKIQAENRLGGTLNKLYVAHIYDSGEELLPKGLLTDDMNQDMPIPLLSTTSKTAKINNALKEYFENEGL